MVTTQLHKSLTIYTPALVPEQKILDFLPYPPNALINAIRANYEMQAPCFTIVGTFPFQLSFPTCIGQHWTFISTSFFSSFIFYTQFQQSNAEIAKACNYSNQGKGLEVMSCQCRSDEDHK